MSGALRNAAKELLDACLAADANEDLDSRIDGSLLDAVSNALAEPPEKIAPVQGWPQGIPWSLHLEAYAAYCKKYGEQKALIDLEGRNCRGGFGTAELDGFIPGWRDKVSEAGKLKAEVARLRAALAAIPEQRPQVPVQYDRLCATLLDKAWAGDCDCGAVKQGAPAAPAEPVSRPNDWIAFEGSSFVAKAGILRALRGGERVYDTDIDNEIANLRADCPFCDGTGKSPIG